MWSHVGSAITGHAGQRDEWCTKKDAPGPHASGAGFLQTVGHPAGTSLSGMLSLRDLCSGEL